MGGKRNSLPDLQPSKSKQMRLKFISESSNGQKSSVNNQTDTAPQSSLVAVAESSSPIVNLEEPPSNSGGADANATGESDQLASLESKDRYEQYFNKKEGTDGKIVYVCKLLKGTDISTAVPCGAVVASYVSNLNRHLKVCNTPPYTL